MKVNIPESDQKRIVVLGAGFGGLTLARKLSGMDVQVVLVDRNNFHQFQPLFYQVAMAGLEPSSISFPLRKIFQRKENVYIRVCEVESINLAKNQLNTSLGIMNYDYLVIATGAKTNFFGNKEVENNVIPMKSVSEALYLRNEILDHYEKALSTPDFEERQSYVDIVIVGGGATGVEVAGALAEMRKYILPKDYGELDIAEVDIYLIQGSGELLNGMSKNASDASLRFLESLGVIVKLNTRVTGYDGEQVFMNDGSSIRTKKVIWAAGVTGELIEGFPDTSKGPGNRLLVDNFCRVKGIENVYAIGDIAYMQTVAYPNGHPQVAQVAIQQGRNLAKNMKLMLARKEHQPFKYKNLGTLATIGRNRAVVDLRRRKFSGRFAWYIWLLVHLFALIGVKNKIIVFLNWVWNYFTYDQSLRLIIKPKVPKEPVKNKKK